MEKKIRRSPKWHPMVGDAWRAGLALDTSFFFSGGGAEVVVVRV